jgi:hypothetical protein
VNQQKLFNIKKRGERLEENKQVFGDLRDNIKRFYICVIGVLQVEDNE